MKDLLAQLADRIDKTRVSALRERTEFPSGTG